MERTLRGIFQTHLETYAKQYRLPAYVHRAAYWIAHCRTADLGGHVRRCPEGHVERAFYNSCHQRGCPQCQALATEQWLERQRARLIACAHHHLIFTLPHELNALWCWNRAAMARLLFGAVRDVLFELLEDPRHLGATPAFIAALHTWGRSASLHPHLHVLAADGGLSADGAWVKPRRSHFLPARVVMLVFRGKFLGFTVSRNEAKLKVADQAIEKLKARIRELTRCTRGHRLLDVVAELRETLLGWKAYFGIAEVLSPLRDIDKWIRRKLRRYHWKQWGRAGYRELRRRGVSVREAWHTSKSAHGPWRLSQTPALALALPARYFSNLGLPSLAAR